eukprot:scpid38745/ scgid1513/ 
MLKSTVSHASCVQRMPASAPHKATESRRCYPAGTPDRSWMAFIFLSLTIALASMNGHGLLAFEGADAAQARSSTRPAEGVGDRRLSYVDPQGRIQKRIHGELPAARVTVDSSGWIPRSSEICKNDKILFVCKNKPGTATVHHSSYSWLWISEDYTSTFSWSNQNVRQGSIRGSCRQSADVVKVSSYSKYTLRCFNGIVSNGTLVCRVRSVVDGYGTYCAYSSVGVQHLNPRLNHIKFSSGERTALIGGLAFMFTTPSRFEVQHLGSNSRHFHVDIKCLAYSEENTFWSYLAAGREGKPREGLLGMGNSYRISHFDNSLHSGRYTCSSVSLSDHGTAVNESFSTYLTAPGHAVVRFTPNIVITPSTDMLTYTGQEVTVKCYSPNTRVQLSWANVSMLNASMYTEKVTHGSNVATTAIGIRIRNVQSDLRFRCRSRMAGIHRSAVAVHIRVKRTRELPKITFWADFLSDVMRLNWIGNTSHLDYSVLRWTLAYTVNNTRPWLLVPTASYFANRGNGKLNSVLFHTYSPYNVYQVQISLSQTNLTNNHSEHIEMFQTSFLSPLIFHPKSGPVSDIIFHLGVPRHHISCAQWSSIRKTSHLRNQVQDAFIRTVSRFVQTVCATCQLQNITQGVFGCANGENTARLSGQLLYPNVEQRQIEDYVRLLADGQFAVTLLTSVPQSVSKYLGADCTLRHSCHEWKLTVDSVCIHTSRGTDPLIVPSGHRKYLSRTFLGLNPQQCSRLPKA